MSTLYLLLPAASRLDLIADAAGALCAGGYAAGAERVQPVECLDGDAACDTVAQERFAMWHGLTATLAASSSAVCSSQLLPPLTVDARQHANGDGMPQWCRRHVACLRALKEQLHPASGDRIAVLASGHDDVAWAYAAKAAYPDCGSMACVMKLPADAVSAGSREVAAAVRPVADTLRQVMPVTLTGVLSDTTYPLVAHLETALALLSAAPRDASGLLAAASNRGSHSVYTVQSLPEAEAARALANVALWGWIADEDALASCAKRLHAESLGEVCASSPVLQAAAGASRALRQLTGRLGQSFQLDVTVLADALCKRLCKETPRQPATAFAAERAGALADALFGISYRLAASVNPYDGTGYVVPAFSEGKPRQLAALTGSPAEWLERANALFLSDDADLKAERSQVMDAWNAFFLHTEKGAPLPAASIGICRLAQPRFSDVRSLLALTAAGRVMIAADVCHELKDADGTVRAIDSPLTGFCFSPSCMPVQPGRELNEADSGFARFVYVYLRTLPDAFSPAFRRYVEREVARHPDRSSIESARPNLFVEFPSFARHVGIDIV